LVYEKQNATIKLLLKTFRISIKNSNLVMNLTTALLKPFMRHFFTLIFFIFSLSLVAQESSSPLDTPDVELQKTWVDSTYNALSLKEKIGQLYMIQVFSSQDEKTKASVLNQISTHHIGGVIYSKGGPVRQAQLNNELQAASKIPLLVGMDAEWGLSMRLDSTYAFPWNMTLGAGRKRHHILCHLRTPLCAYYVKSTYFLHIIAKFL